MTMKGSCNGSPIDWLYYIKKDENKNIFYEGYKNSKIFLKNGSWHLTDYVVKSSDLIVELDAGKDGSKSPLGRHQWKRFDKSCGLGNENPIDSILTLSSCIFGEEFTCDSGECVNIFLRCDKKRDCMDGSDERNCIMIRTSPEYEKSSPPELEQEANPIFTQIDVLNIDFVDIVSMTVGMTVEIHLTWRDPKLTYENILDGKEKFGLFKVITEREIEKIWTPMPKLIHENAVIGKVVEDKVFYVKIVGRSNPEKMNIVENVETLLFPGSENDLFMSQRFKLEYRCDFFVKNFPFDEQVCDFIMLMNVEGNKTIALAESRPPVIYKGPHILQSFELADFSANTSTTEYQTRFIYSIKFERLYMHTLETSFFQSFILWVIAYFSLYIDIADFSDRFMGALTSLLVLAALLASMNASLPQTAYFKHIDVWFFCFIVNIVLIIFIHIVVDFFINREKDYCVAVPPKGISSMNNMTKEKLEEKKTSARINNVAKIILPLFIIFFLVAYFSITTME